MSRLYPGHSKLWLLWVDIIILYKKHNVLILILVGEYSGFHLRDVREPLLQGEGSRRVVCVCLDDRLLGEPRVSDYVPHSRHGKIPRHSLAHDWVRVLCSLDLLLFFCSTGSCSWGKFYLKWRSHAVIIITIFAGPLQWPPWCRLLLRVRGDVRVRAGRRAQVPGLEGGAAGPGRAQGDADCDQLTLSNTCPMGSKSISWRIYLCLRVLLLCLL